MKTDKRWLLALGLAGILQLGIALYHVVLPYQWDWTHALGVGTLPPAIVWALYALNFSWSFLLLSVSSLVIYAATIGPAAGPFARRSLFAVGLFWAIHGSYVWHNPLPLPTSLSWLKIGLVAFPATLVALHWIPLLIRTQSNPTADRVSVMASGFSIPRERL